MVDDDEWRWVVEHALVDCDHLLFATSLPVLMPPGLHDLETWNESICDGRWGRRAARLGEKMRRELDLEDWGSFAASFERFFALVRDVATPGRGGDDRTAGAAGNGRRPPGTVCILSGDVHFTYHTAAELVPQSGRPEPESVVHQLVCSPIRNALTKRERLAVRFGLSRVGRGVGWVLRRLSGRPSPPVRWHVGSDVIFNNTIGLLELDGRSAHAEFLNGQTDERQRIPLSGDHPRV
jgi:hypothetical protein